MRPTLVVGVVLLAFPQAAVANGIVYRPKDPGYQRARAAETVAPIVVATAFAATVAWVVRSRGRGRVAAVVVLVTFLYLFLALYDGKFDSSTRIAHPDEPESGPERFERQPPPGWTTENEQQAGAALTVIAIAGGGIWVARRSRAGRPNSRTQPGLSAAERGSLGAAGRD